jgi:hypothetical protein
MSKEPQTAAEKEAFLKEYASLVWNVGTILEDRRSDYYVGSDLSEIWDYLYENLDVIYEQIGPVIDRVEDQLFASCEFEQRNPHEWYCTTHDVLKIAGTQEPVSCGKE